jgi:hypothetical protein
MDTCQDFMDNNVDFRQFLDGSLVDGLSLSLCKLEVSHLIKTKTYGTKNKVFKPQGTKMYLNLYIIYLLTKLLTSSLIVIFL